MRVTYVGRHDGVEVVTVDGLLLVEHGESVEVSDAAAHGTPAQFDDDGLLIAAGVGGLLDQTDNWQPASVSAPKGKQAAPVAATSEENG